MVDQERLRRKLENYSGRRKNIEKNISEAKKEEKEKLQKELKSVNENISRLIKGLQDALTFSIPHF